MKRLEHQRSRWEMVVGELMMMAEIPTGLADGLDGKIGQYLGFGHTTRYGEPNNGPQKFISSSPNLWICYLAWQKRLADTLKLRCTDYPGLSGWTQCNLKSPYKRNMEAEGSESKKELWQWKQRSEWCKTSSYGINQADSSASRRWKRHGNEDTRRNAALPTHFRTLISRTVK